MCQLPHLLTGSSRREGCCGKKRSHVLRGLGIPACPVHRHAQSTASPNPGSRSDADSTPPSGKRDRSGKVVCPLCALRGFFRRGDPAPASPRGREPRTPNGHLGAQPGAQGPAQQGCRSHAIPFTSFLPEASSLHVPPGPRS